MWRCSSACLALLIGMGVSRVALASDNAAAAEALFVEGRDLLQDGKLDLACPKLAESHKLDPATGTLLALAICYERQGKIASAWAAYAEVVTRAQNEKNAEREKAAQEKATALEKTLPRLVIEVAPELSHIEDLRIVRDGTPIGRGSFGSSIPVDPGEHRVQATADAREPFSTRITVGAGETKTVVVGPMRALGPLQEEQPFFTPMRKAGVGVAAVGIVGLGIAGGLAGAALGKKNESDLDCVVDACSPRGIVVRNEARGLGDGATVALISGGVLVAAGATLFLLGGPKAPATTGQRSVWMVPFASPTSAGLAGGGKF